MQSGWYAATQGFPSGHNLTDNDWRANYTFLNSTNTYTSFDLEPALGTCFSTKAQEARSTDERLVDECAVDNGYCCFNFTKNPVAKVSS